MKDSTLKCQVLKQVNDCEYDMDLMLTLADIVIEMAGRMEDTHIKKYVGDSGKDISIIGTKCRDIAI